MMPREKYDIEKEAVIKMPPKKTKEVVILDKKEYETIKSRIASLEDALKRAEGIPSIEDIDRLLDKHTVIANDDILYRKGIAQAIHALINKQVDK